MTARPQSMPKRPTPAATAPAAPGQLDLAIDVLSDVLRSIRLRGALLFLVEVDVPWRTHAPAAHAFARHAMPGAARLISYHVLVRGSCWGGLQGEAPCRMEPGDVLVVPHGDPYFLAAPADAPAGYADDQAVDFFRRMASGDLPPLVSHAATRPGDNEFLCCFLGCDAPVHAPVLASLPRVMHVRGGAGAEDHLAGLARIALGEIRAGRQGARELLLRLGELMFVEVVRRHLASRIGIGSDWLAGLADPVVGRALALLHAQPERAWSLDRLAARVGISRSTLAERFVRFVGQPPMHYLAAWRMQLAARMLREERAKVQAVAQAVGYVSEAAFSRAFKRHTGKAPSLWPS